MELHQLRTFVTVAEEGHLTRAAERLHVSQPAVSGHIRSLEDELGVPLFIRTPKGMSLTREGLALRDQACQALESVAGIALQAKSFKGEAVGEIMIALNTYAGFLKVVDLAAMVSAKHPKASLNIRLTMSGLVLAGVRDRIFEGGFFFGDNPHPELKAVFLRPVNLLIAGPAAWADRIVGATWTDLAELPWIWTPEQCPCHHVVSAKFEELGVSPAQRMVADNDEILNTLVCGGNGVGPMIEEEAIKARDAGQVVIWEGDAMRTKLSFGYRADRENEPAVKALLYGIGQVWNVKTDAD